MAGLNPLGQPTLYAYGPSLLIGPFSLPPRSSSAIGGLAGTTSNQAALIAGAIHLGGLFPVHVKGKGNEVRGKINEQRGIQVMTGEGERGEEKGEKKEGKNTDYIYETLTLRRLEKK
jgi:hypothetical protein